MDIGEIQHQHLTDLLSVKTPLTVAHAMHRMSTLNMLRAYFYINMEIPDATNTNERS